MSKEKLNELEGRVTALKEKKIRTEEKLKNLRDQKAGITAELDALGVVPKDLGAVISKLEAEIRTKLTDIDAQIPDDVT